MYTVVLSQTESWRILSPVDGQKESGRTVTPIHDDPFSDLLRLLEEWITLLWTLKFYGNGQRLFLWRGVALLLWNLSPPVREQFTASKQIIAHRSPWKATLLQLSQRRGQHVLAINTSPRQRTFTEGRLRRGGQQLANRLDISPACWEFSEMVWNSFDPVMLRTHSLIS